MINVESLYLNTNIIQIGWTLIHFIWQAALVAILLFLALRCIRNNASSLRYWFSFFALLLTVILPVTTTIFLHTEIPILKLESTRHLSIENENLMEIIAQDRTHTKDEAMPVVSLRNTIVQQIDRAIPFIVFGWTVGVMMFSIWHLGGLAQTHTLKRRNKQLSNEWKRKINQLANAMGIKRAIKVVGSLIVKVPTVIGCFRPVLLLPVSAISGLPYHHLEAILLHELAHIRRYDCLFNFFQIIIETLGFFHPAVWWISRKIREERENCCDDFAVRILKSNVVYAKSLLHIAKIKESRTQYALAADSYSLMHRIQRLLEISTRKKKVHSWMIGLILSALISSITLGAVLISSPASFTANNNWESLFDGNSLRGWDVIGHDAKFYIKDKMICGTTSQKRDMSYLCTQKQYHDFILEFDVKIDTLLNSGVQFRSNIYAKDTITWVINGGKQRQFLQKAGKVYGYQVEIDPSGQFFSGGVFDQARRGWFSDFGETEDRKNVFLKYTWNKYRVLCHGDTIKTWINGVLCTDIMDKLSREGFIGLQVYNRSRVPRLSVYWKNLRIKAL